MKPAHQIAESIAHSCIHHSSLITCIEQAIQRERRDSADREEELRGELATKDEVIAKLRAEIAEAVTRMALMAEENERLKWQLAHPQGDLSAMTAAMSCSNPRISNNKQLRRFKFLGREFVNHKTRIKLLDENGFEVVYVVNDQDWTSVVYKSRLPRNWKASTKKDCELVTIVIEYNVNGGSRLHSIEVKP